MFSKAEKRKERGKKTEIEKDEDWVFFGGSRSLAILVRDSNLKDGQGRLSLSSFQWVDESVPGLLRN
ncbi:hypothetical protein TNCV_3750891 [Trichonephila clavipes]|uniref:Uncharacterized protein n=1 Tax=Trichonephila clavipes TaxID=2585209 RepID=A0A8X6R1V7_TRICX|nr:hypothetical protein TNCV_3750891 [Trichonephila clavipes]